MNLVDKVIVVTGSARGIGLELARSLLDKGARLALVDINAEGLAEAVAGIGAGPERLRSYGCDVSDEAMVEATFAAVLSDFGRLDGLVNNAGILRDNLLLKVESGKVTGKMSVEDYSLVVDVHMKGAFLCAREAALHMIETGVDDGCIVNISSISAAGNIGQTNYSAAKAGMTAQSRVWAKELGRYGIRSVVVAPGAIDTDMLRSMPDNLLERLVKQIPLRRVGTTDHIALAVTQAFENDYLTGTVIEVNGGGAL